MICSCNVFTNTVTVTFFSCPAIFLIFLGPWRRKWFLKAFKKWKVQEYCLPFQSKLLQRPSVLMRFKIEKKGYFLFFVCFGHRERERMLACFVLQSCSPPPPTHTHMRTHTPHPHDVVCKALKLVKAKMFAEISSNFMLYSQSTNMVIVGREEITNIIINALCWHLSF